MPTYYLNSKLKESQSSRKCCLLKRFCFGLDKPITVLFFIFDNQKIASELVTPKLRFFIFMVSLMKSE
jgi:hypothetical protein